MAKANTKTNSAREKSKDLPSTQPVYAGRTDAKVPGGVTSILKAIELLLKRRFDLLELRPRDKTRLVEV